MISPPSPPTCESVRADIEYLSDAWPYIVTLRIPGTARSWAETPRRGALTESDLERMGKKGVPRQAPADVGVLDLLQRIATIVDDVAHTVFDVADLGEDFYPIDTVTKDPRPWLSSMKTWLAQAQERDSKTVSWVHQELAPLCTAAAHLLGDIRAGQVMNGICPWCQGRESDGSTGGRTLQIHYPHLEKRGEEPLIICMGVGCSPPSTACGERWRGHPAWPQREWDWLARQLSSPNDMKAQVV